MNIWLITVNYGNISATQSLLKSLSKCKLEKPLKVFIADNESTNKSLSSLEKEKKYSNLEIDIFANKKNLYYWPAAKKVLSGIIDKEIPYPDWILICNNDITFPDINFFNQLKKIDVNKYPIIGPNIINTSGLSSNPFMVAPLKRLERLYWDFYFISYYSSHFIRILTKWYKLFKTKNLIKDQILPNKVYAIHGSAMLFSSKFFRNGGWLDDSFELYGEEISVAKIAKEINLPITYFPTLKLIHNEHSTTKKADKYSMFQKAKASYKYNK
jgi:GT2 family glycosyltransferase